MKEYTCAACGGSFRCHVGRPDRVGRKLVCPGCKHGPIPAAAPSTKPRPAAPRAAAFADLDPGERRLYRSPALAWHASLGSTFREA